MSDQNTLSIFDNAGWVRDFPAEQLGWFTHLANKFLAKKIRPSALADRQARFVDTNFYYRLGGVDPAKAKTENDILAIQWGIGSRQAETYLEQVSIAQNNGQKYTSWWIHRVSTRMCISARYSER